MIKHFFIFKSLLLIILCNNGFSQVYIGAYLKDANYMQYNKNKVIGSSLDYNLELKYQFKNMNISIDYGNANRLNMYDNNIIETEKNRFALMLNYLPIKENQKFGIGLGFGYFLRMPYKKTSLSLIDNYYNTGICSNVNLNFFTKNGYISLGMRYDLDLNNSKNINGLKSNDYGFYIGITQNLTSLFKKK